MPAFPPSILEAISQDRWEELFESIAKQPFLAQHIDDQGRSLLHYVCLQPETPSEVVANYLAKVPTAIATLSRSKETLCVTKCSRPVAIVLAKAGYPKAVKQVACLPPRWQESQRCALCQSTFNTLKRRHHCRNCGRSVCAAHSKNKAPLTRFGLKGEARVCDGCFQSQDNQVTHER